MDFSLLDLFRVELENNSRVLETGLVSVEGLEDSRALEPLMRAAHSIKGAARIVGLDVAVTLAHAMEDVLSAAQQGKLRLGTVHVDALLRGNDIFLRLSTLDAEKIALELTQEEAAIHALGDRIRELLDSPSQRDSPRAESPAAPKETPPVAPKQPPPPPEPLKPPSAGPPTPPFDPFLMDLFKVELENNSRILETGLVALESDDAPEKIEPLMRAAHSIKGAARIVGLDGAVILAHAMEDVLSAAQKGKVMLDACRIDYLLRGNDVFNGLAQLEAERIPARLIEEADTIGALTGSISGLLTGESPAEPRPREPETAVCPDTTPKKETPREESSVRVLAENLNRLMGLAGESLVRARSAKPFSINLLKLKGGHTDLAELLEGLLLSPRYAPLPEPVTEAVVEALKQLEDQRYLLIRHIEEFEHFSRRIEYTAEQVYNEVVASRMRPFSDGLHGFPRLVRDLSLNLGKKIRLEVRGASARVDRDILEKLEAPLNHLLRNAVDHGIESPEERTAAGKPQEGTIVLDARHVFGMLNITISDDGQGIDMTKLRRKIVRDGHVSEDMAGRLSTAELFEFLFLPGFSTAGKVTEISGRGVGLDVVASMVHEVGGTVRVESELGKGCTFHLQLPLTLSVIRALLVEICGESYAIPLTRIDRVLEVDPAALQIIEDRQFYTIDDENIGIIDAPQILQLPPAENSTPRLSIAVISDRLTRYGLVVDRFCGESELVVRPLDPRLGKVPNISSGAFLNNGTPTLIFDVDDLVRSIDNRLAQGKFHRIGDRSQRAGSARKRVLVVDDSLTVRQVERKLLENSGYEVIMAVDGMDGWNVLQSEAFDLVISDVDMPRMNGIELVRRIKDNPVYRNLPVMIISYKDREEDRMRGLEAGANYYLSKGSFHDESLIEAVRDLIGEP